MSLIYIDGFDAYNGTGANTGMQATWTILTPGGLGSSTSQQTGRFGGKCYRASTNAGAFYMQKTFTGAATCVIGVAIRQVTFPTSARAPHQIILANADGDQLRVLFTWEGKIEIYRAGSTLTYTSPSQVVFINTWHYVEIEFTLSATVGVINFYLDGVGIYTATGLNTKTGSTSTVIDRLRLGLNDGTGAGSGTCGVTEFDDLYIKDDTSRLGERRVQTLYPSGDVAAGWTRLSGASNYLMVNEAQVDGDTTYNFAASSGLVDTYNFDDVSGTPAQVDGVQFGCFAYKTDAGTRKIALQVKSGATTSDGSDFALNASYSRFTRLMIQNPDGTVDWTYTTLNAIQGGPKVTV
jgi:hypothetical protein